jgi:hypothetical protein
MNEQGRDKPEVSWDFNGYTKWHEIDVIVSTPVFGLLSWSLCKVAR